MRMTVVGSSNLDRIGYDLERQVLYVMFQNGAYYAYQGVPDSIYTDLMNANSMGRYFNRHIRNHYPYERLAQPIA